MSKKLYDLVVKVGEYTNSQGEVKSRYKNVGSAMQGDNGTFLIIDRAFNFAGVPNPENRDSVIVSCFEPKDNQQAPQQSARPQQPAPQQFKADDDFDDSTVPFWSKKGKRYERMDKQPPGWR